jgi:hypothetical protein
MRTLTKLALAALLGLSTFKLSSQDFNLPEETDPYKFIPEWAPRLIVHSRNNINLRAVWYNPEFQIPDEYRIRLAELNGKIPWDELYIDINEDGILDMPLDEFYRLRIRHLEIEKLERSWI